MGFSEGHARNSPLHPEAVEIQRRRSPSSLHRVGRGTRARAARLSRRVRDRDVAPRDPAPARDPLGAARHPLRSRLRPLDRLRGAPARRRPAARIARIGATRRGVRPHRVLPVLRTHLHERPRDARPFRDPPPVEGPIGGAPPRGGRGRVHPEPRSRGPLLRRPPRRGRRGSGARDRRTRRGTEKGGRIPRGSPLAALPDRGGVRPGDLPPGGEARPCGSQPFPSAAGPDPAGDARRPRSPERRDLPRVHEGVPLLPGGVRLSAGAGARPARPPAVPPGGGAQDGIRRGGAPVAVRRRLQLRRPARHGGDGGARSFERVALPPLASPGRVAREHGPADPQGSQVGIHARAGSGYGTAAPIGQQGDPGRRRTEDGRVDLRERLADPQALLHGRPARGDGGRRPGDRGAGRPGRRDRASPRKARFRDGERLRFRPEAAHPVPVGTPDRTRGDPGADPPAPGRAGTEPPRGGEVPLPGDLRARGSLLARGRPAAGGDRAGVPERRAVRRVDGGVPARRVEACVRGGGGRPARIPAGTRPAGSAPLGVRGRRDRPGVSPPRAREGPRGGDDARLPRRGLLLLRGVPPGAVEHHVPRTARGTRGDRRGGRTRPAPGAPPRSGTSSASPTPRRVPRNT